jgi:heat shock protein HtpX
MTTSTWRGRDRGLQGRILLTFFLLGLLYVVFITALIAFGTSALLIVLIMGAFVLAQVFFSDKIALRAMKARVTEPHEAPELHATIERICQLNDIPKPKVAVAETDMPNAFATGHSRKSATVCATTGLMQQLEPAELEGVMAHELGHIVHRDVIVMTIAGFIATIAGLLIRINAYGGISRGGRNGGGASAFAVIMLVSVAVYVISFLLLRALSRYREYAADRAAAGMTGRPATLASALNKISGSMSRIPERDLRAAEGMNAFFILPAVAHGFSLTNLISTHPPTEKRVERLMEMQARMDAMAEPRL